MIEEITAFYAVNAVMERDVGSVIQEREVHYQKESVVKNEL